MHPSHTRKVIGQGKTDERVCKLDKVVQELSCSTNTQDEGVERPLCFSGGEMIRQADTQDASFIVKITDKCNQNCQYCYYRNNALSDSRLTMSSETLRYLIEKLIDYNRKFATFVWHGGEPLMAGRDLFENIVAYQQKALHATGDNIQVVNCIQTNGLLLDDEWASFFKRHGFNVSISLDGPKDLHIANRGTSDKQYDRILQGLDSLRRAGLSITILSVVTANTLGREDDILEFCRANGIDSLSFLPMHYGNSNDCISDSNYANFLSSFFARWAASNLEDLKVREFDEAIRGHIGIDQELCQNRDACHLFFTVSPTGQIYPCDCFPQTEETILGSLDDPLDELIKKNGQFLSRGANLSEECHACDLLSVCHGGCTYHRWIRDRNYAEKQFYCGTAKALSEAIASELTKA